MYMHGVMYLEVGLFMELVCHIVTGNMVCSSLLVELFAIPIHIETARCAG